MARPGENVMVASSCNGGDYIDTGTSILCGIFCVVASAWSCDFVRVVSDQHGRSAGSRDDSKGRWYSHSPQ